MIKDINARELREMIKNNSKNLEIIDVRELFEYEQVHIKGSKLIPMQEISGKIDLIDWSKQVVFICRSGSRSRYAAEIVSEIGKEAYNLVYGIMECAQTGGEFLEK